MKVNIGFEIISGKHYLSRKCVKNGKHNKVKRRMRVTITMINMQGCLRMYLWWSL